MDLEPGIDILFAITLLTIDIVSMEALLKYVN